MVTQRIIPTTMDGFRGDYFFLSNMYPCEIPYQGLVFRSSEHLYQWMKVRGIEPWASKILNAEHGGHAKRITREEGFPETEYTHRRIENMWKTIRAKFADETLARMLVDTDGVELVEYNWWKDTFWGVYEGKGKNMLGKLLMHKRRMLIERQSK